MKEGRGLQYQKTGSLRDANGMKYGEYKVFHSHNSASKKSVGLESDEDRLMGTVSWRLYWKYLRAGLGIKSLTALSLFFILAQGG